MKARDARYSLPAHSVDWSCKAACWSADVQELCKHEVAEDKKVGLVQTHCKSVLMKRGRLVRKTRRSMLEAKATHKELQPASDAAVVTHVIRQVERPLGIAGAALDD